MLPFGIHETCPYPLHMVNMLGQATWIQLNFKFISLCKGCHQLPKRERLEALALFWWIDETLSDNLVYQSDHEIGSTIPSGGAMVKIMVMVWWPWWLSARLGKEEREKQKAQGKGETWQELFGLVIKTLSELITFRIDSHTIKRGETHRKMLLSKCH